VIWSENFTESTVAGLLARYNSVSNPSGVSIVSITSQNNKPHRAVRLIAGGSHWSSDLYKAFSGGYQEVYIRYYANYETNGPWHHTGVWFGGYNPAQQWPSPHAGTRPTGYDRFLIALEPIPTFAGSPMDFYAIWRGMHSYDPQAANPTYWGNTLIHNASFKPNINHWDCYEIHLQLNPEMTSSNGAVLEVWRNDYLIQEFTATAPLGYWVADKYCPANATGKECTAYLKSSTPKGYLDQRWRLTSNLKINNIWLQNYNTTTTTSILMLADLVVSTQRVGCDAAW